MKTFWIIMAINLFSGLLIGQSFKGENAINYMTDPSHPKTIGEGNPVDDIRNIGANYEEVTVGNGIQLYLSSGTNDQLTVNAQKNLLPLIETVVDQATLTIRLNSSLQTGKGIRVYLHADRIKRLTIKEGGFIHTDSPITAQKIELTLQSGSTGNGQFNVEDFQCLLMGGSELHLTGQSANSQILVKGYSQLNGKSFSSHDSKVTVLGKSSCKLRTISTLKAKAENESTFYYYGDPEIQEKKVALKGVIKQKGK